jgi:hypothetical protein
MDVPLVEAVSKLGFSVDSHGIFAILKPLLVNWR